MTDVFSKSKRSWIMSRVKSFDTKPEVIVRSLLHRLGYRFRLHRKSLPGTPDIVLPKYHTVIFVHGCFWHRHRGCKYSSTPKDNVEYWIQKFETNKQRDKLHKKKLENLGWKVIVIWECQVRNIEQLSRRLQKVL